MFSKSLGIKVYANGKYLREKYESSECLLQTCRFSLMRLNPLSAHISENDETPLFILAYISVFKEQVFHALASLFTRKSIR